MRIDLVNNSLVNSRLNNKTKTLNNHSVSIPSFKARLNKDIYQRTISGINIDFKKYLERDWDGNLPIFNATVTEMKNIHDLFADFPELIAKMHLMSVPMIDDYQGILMHYTSVEKAKEIHRALKDYPEFLAQIHLKKNSWDALPMHYASAEKAKEIHRALENQPDVITQIHLTGKPNTHDLPMHYADAEKTKEIHRALENQPDVIAQIHLTQDKSGNLPIHVANLETIQEINRVLENQPEVLAKMYLTRNYRNEPQLPIRIYPKYLRSSFNSTEEIKKEAFNAIAKAALNSDLDTNTSIELLETYNVNGEFSEAIKELKKVNP